MTKKKTTNKATAPVPMDPSILESVTGTAKPNRKRRAYALHTLINEVLDLFPETTYEVSGYDGLNAALDVQFYVEHAGLAALLWLVESDERVREVISELAAGQDGGGEEFLVSLKPNARTKDSREPFGLAAAWEILADQYGDFPGVNEGSL